MTNETNSPDRTQLKHLSAATLLEEGGHSRFVKRSILFISLMLLIFFAWSVFTQVDEVAVSFGEVQPVADVQNIQHLEGGIVSAVFVKNSQEVKKGEPLIQFNPEPTRGELLKTEGKAISLQLSIARLQAFIQHTPPEKVGWQDVIKHLSLNSVDNKSRIDELVTEEKNLLARQNKDRADQKKVLEEKIEQRQSKILQITGLRKETEKQLVLYEKEETMYKTLAPKGYISERDYITAQRHTIDVQSQMKQLHEQTVEAKSALEESQLELDKLESALTKDAQRELSQTSEQLLETQHMLARLLDANRRLILKAPIAGIVKGLTALPNSVIPPGETIMELIPTEGDMRVECRVSPHDIGHVSVGDSAQVKVMAYDYARYGGVQGKLSEISASTFLNKEGLPFYKVKVLLDRNYVGHDPKQNPLKPGMTVEVNIITGKKSIMMYLLKPITRALDSAFKER